MGTTCLRAPRGDDDLRACSWPSGAALRGSGNPALTALLRGNLQGNSYAAQPDATPHAIGAQRVLGLCRGLREGPDQGPCRCSSLEVGALPGQVAQWDWVRNRGEEHQQETTH